MLALRLLESVSGPDSFVLFDEYFNTTGAPKVVGLLFDPLLRPVTVQAVAVLACCFTWCGSLRSVVICPFLFCAECWQLPIADVALGICCYRGGGPAGGTVLRMSNCVVNCSCATFLQPTNKPLNRSHAAPVKSRNRFRFCCKK